MSDIEEKVKKWCESKIGKGYIYGATGWICSAARRQQQAAQYPDYYDMIMNVGKKWDGIQCYDCAQFTRYAANEGGLSFPSGATSQWNKVDWAEKGEIANLPKDKVCFLYRQSGSKMQHTGVYQGDGTVIDSRGTKYGILHTKLSDYAWTHYAIPNWSEKEEEEFIVLYQAKVIADKGSTVNMRASASTTAKVLKKVPVGDTVDVGQESSEWCKIEYDETEGYMMSKFLQKIEDGEESEEEESEEEGEESTSETASVLDEANIAKIEKYMENIMTIINNNKTIIGG